MSYRTSVFNRVLSGALSLAGVDPTNNEARASALEFLNARLREAWEYEYWPELTPAEKRAWRDTWDVAKTYDAGAEVFFTDSAGVAGYYAANSSPNNPAAGESPEDEPTKWTALVEFRRYVALDQTDQTPIGEVEGLYDRDPYAWPTKARRIPFILTTDGIVPRGYACNTVWVRFRLRPPVFTLDAYAGGSAYAKGATVYYATTGECYRAKQSTTGDAPTNTAYWEQLLFPYVLEPFVKRAVFADLLPADGATNKGQIELGKAYQALNHACDTIFAGQSQYTRAAVQSY